MEKPQWIAKHKQVDEFTECFEYWENKNHIVATGDKDFIEGISRAIMGFTAKEDKDANRN